MNQKKIKFLVLKNIQDGITSIDNELFQSIEEYGTFVENLIQIGLIRDANIVRAGQGNKVQMIFLDNAKLTEEGYQYIENYAEYTDEELHQLVLQIIEENTGSRKKATAHLIRRKLPEHCDMLKIEWILNNLVDEKLVRRVKGEPYKGINGKLEKGENYYEFLLKKAITVKGDAKTVIGKKIFIIHGHDELMKNQVQLLLTRAGLDDIVLHEQPDKGRTIIDKLIGETKDACYAVALMSPDDQVNEEKRARQNVILEIGFFIGMLGKERVRLLVKDDIEIPSDLQGIIYEPFDKSGNWRMKLLKELQAAGIDFDITEVVKKL